MSVYSKILEIINGQARTIDLSSAGNTLNVNALSSASSSLGTVTSGTWNGSAIGISYGGTGQTSAAAAFAALSPLTTAGDIIYEDATPAPARLPIGSTGQVLTVVSGLPAWASVSASANEALSNLSAVAINTSLLPGADNSINLGSASKSWASANIHTLLDGSSVVAVDAYNRYLKDASAAIAVDFGNRLLEDSSGNVAVDFGNRYLKDSSNNAQLSWSTSGIQLGVQNSLAGVLAIANGTSNASVIISAGHVSSSYNFNLPATAGSAGQVLVSQGGGSNAMTWASAATGTVTSVALADGSTTPIYTISNSPVTSTGTLTFTLNTQSANVVFAGPSSGSAAQPSFRSLVANDIPSLSSIYLALSGGTMSGAIAMGSNKITGLADGSASGDAVAYDQAILANGANAFTADQSMGSYKLTNLANGSASGDAVNYGQLSAISTGLIWQNSINDPDLVDDSLSSPPVSPVYSITYIIAASPTGAWTGLAGHAVWYDGTDWVDLSTGNTAVSGQGTAVQVGDRFAVAIASSGGPAHIGGGLTGYHNYIVTVTGNTPGSFTYTYTAPVNNYAMTVSDAGSQHYGSSFTYVGSSTSWVDFSGPSKVNAGAALAYDGNTLNVQYDNSTIDLSGNNLEVKAGGITNTQVSASAAIAYSKLNLSGSIVNADINSSAAIAYSKLALTGDIVNADISASAAIAFSKLAALSSAEILVGNGSNVATAVAVSGDLTLANTGAFTIAANAVTASKISTGAFDQVTITGGGGSAAAVVRSPAVITSEVSDQSLSASTLYALRYALSSDAGSTAGRMWKADNDATSNDNFYVIGLAYPGSSVSQGGAITVVELGLINVPSHGFTTGAPLYLGASGALTSTAPTSANLAVVRVGMVKDANNIWVDPAVVGVN